MPKNCFLVAWVQIMRSKKIEKNEIFNNFVNNRKTFKNLIIEKVMRK